MNKIKCRASVGNAKQNADCVIEIKPRSKGVKINLDSLVKNQYGDAIKRAVKSELKKQDVEAAEITIIDRGAIDPVLRARLECVIKRGRGL